MSAAADPRRNVMWPEFLIAARTVIEDFGYLAQADVDEIAEAVTERLLGTFLAEAERDSEIVFGMDGRGPFCSWCLKLPGPALSPGHPQYGVFCTCRREEKSGSEEEVPAS
jgi:hypothetical protein